MITIYLSKHYEKKNEMERGHSFLYLCCFTCFSSVYRWIKFPNSEKEKHTDSRNNTISVPGIIIRSVSIWKCS